jgi:CO dehydrogenase/acetyl-CoA synthase beta subunit
MVFDAYIQKMAEYVEDLRAKGRQVNVFSAQSSIEDITAGLPVKVGPGAGSGIILRDDTHVELGNPEIGSSSFMLFTDKTEIIKDGRITVIGPDIKESAGKSLPFGQVLMISGRGLDDSDHEALRHAGFIGDQIEGYMVRSFTQSIWSRVGKGAAGKGFSLETLGRALMVLYKSDNSKIESMEAIFVTSGKVDINKLDEIAGQVQKITKELVKETWKIRGYDIDCISDCSTCNDKLVCDEIKEVLKEKKKMTIKKEYLQTSPAFKGMGILNKK